MHNLLFALRLLVLPLVVMVCFIVSAMFAMPTLPEQPDATPDVFPLLVFAAAVAWVLAYAILRSSLYGWRLMLLVALAVYGLMTVLTQVETVVFLRDKVPPGFLPGMFLMGAIFAALCATALVFVLGKARRRRGAGEAALPALVTRDLVWKLPVLSVIFVVIYFGFGYFVAWQEPALRSYYGGDDAGSFVAQMNVVAGETPWLFPFQALRGIAWVVFLLPIVRSLKGSILEAGAAGALLSAVWSLMLLIPNPFMPAGARPSDGSLLVSAAVQVCCGGARVRRSEARARG